MLPRPTGHCAGGCVHAGGFDVWSSGPGPSARSGCRANEVAWVGETGRRSDRWVPHAAEWVENRLRLPGDHVDRSAERAEHDRRRDAVLANDLTIGPMSSQAAALAARLDR